MAVDQPARDPSRHPHDRPRKRGRPRQPQLALAPAAGPLEPGPLSEAIDRDFGGFDRFKARFERAAMALFGSGWVWLASAKLDGGALKIYTTHGHDNPISNGHFPVLVADLWEHAYYLKHGNRRAEYLNAWWAVVDWKAVSRRFDSKVKA